MACTYDITTDRGKVRLLIADTSTTSCTFSDAEIDVFLTMASDVIYVAAAMALEAWAATLSDSATQEKIGDYAYTKKEAANKTALAQKYRDLDMNAPYMTWSEPDFTYGSGITAEED